MDGDGGGVERSYVRRASYMRSEECLCFVSGAPGGNPEVRGKMAYARSRREAAHVAVNVS